MRITKSVGRSVLARAVGYGLSEASQEGADRLVPLGPCMNRAAKQ